MLNKLIIISLAVISISCASLKAHDPLRNADGSLNIPKILQWAEYGLEADCTLPGIIPQRICSIGVPAIQAAQAAADKNPSAAAMAASNSLAATRDAFNINDSTIFGQYFNWAINLLMGISK
jgi:hypothetical protein